MITSRVALLGGSSDECFGAWLATLSVIVRTTTPVAAFLTCTSCSPFFLAVRVQEVEVFCTADTFVSSAYTTASALTSIFWLLHQPPSRTNRPLDRASQASQASQAS